MKKLMMFLVVITASFSSQAATPLKQDCSAKARTAFKKSILAFGIPNEWAKFEWLNKERKTNVYGEQVLIFTSGAFGSDGSYIPESGGEIILRKSDCQVLKVVIDVFSGLE